MTVAALMVRSSLDAIPSDRFLKTKFRKKKKLDGVNEEGCLYPGEAPKIRCVTRTRLTFQTASRLQPG
jgi:hypothetical protein